MGIQLSTGDIIVDLKTGDVGVLVNRYSLFGEESKHDYGSLWAWDVYWVGRFIDSEFSLEPWTENGLINIIESGAFEHHKIN